MDLLFTAILKLMIWIKNCRYIKFLLTARVLIVGSQWPIEGHLDLWWLGMYVTVSKLWNMVVVGTSFTLENVKIWPYLPIDLTPWDPVCLPHESNKLFQVPSPINHMLCSDLTVIINVRFGLSTVEYLTLTHTEKLVAVCTLVKIIPFLFKKQLQLFHEKPTYKFIFSLFQNIETINWYFSSHISYNLWINATHVYLHLGDFFNMLNKEVKAFFH